MENASKALIMAGGILVGVIIITIGVYVFATFGATSEEIQTEIEQRALAEFNTNFTKYLGNNKCTIHDIVSLANFAKKYNQDLDYSEADSKNQYYVNVIIKSKGDLTLKTQQELTNLLDKFSTRGDTDSETGESKTVIQYYTCDTIRYDDNNKVNYIEFKRNTEV